MAALFALDNEPRVDRLILLAPAINMGPFSQSFKGPLKIPVQIFHGTNDEVIPLEDVRRIAWNRFQNLVFHEMDDDHSLHGTFKTLDWDELLG
jgi:alpha-beta hydrolase superfamily lysophospholipase